jgi:hypothetical protein
MAVVDIPPGLVTVTLPGPVLEPRATAMVATIEVALTKELELTEIPAFEKVTTAPLAKPLPVIVMFSRVAPCASEDGEADVVTKEVVDSLTKANAALGA